MYLDQKDWTVYNSVVRENLRDEIINEKNITSGILIHKHKRFFRVQFYLHTFVIHQLAKQCGSKNKIS